MINRCLDTQAYVRDTQSDMGFILLAALMSPLMKPSQPVSAARIPKLGSGKNDLSRAKQIALDSSA